MGDRTWPTLLSALLRREDLSTEDIRWAMGEIFSGTATQAQTAAFLVALRAKGETAAEVAGCAEVMLQFGAKVPASDELRNAAVDIVGTGGDRANTVNISTMAAVVTAAAGVPVVKHGNRAASSSTGAADLLERLGVTIDMGPEDVARCAAEIGIGFCFAARFHPAMRHVGVPRREMGIPTVFNFLGPLTNPAQPTAATIGCFDPRMAPVMAGVMAERGYSVLLVRGEDGLDEFTTAAPTRVWLVSGGTVSETLFDSVDLGLPRSAPGDLRGGDSEYNADVARRMFAGEPGPVRDAVLLNAAAAIAARAGALTVDGLSGQLKAGLDRAAAAVDAGAATDLVARWTAFKPAEIAP
ncbi:anthranilate phosphoribosyltransferase [Dactylosporangium vinaceum]|uniref:Anthranilate phosphoribosyltransferase n=1 Tax=Dactylosporangium vinaceum TaxID=53362 RepID=A0ABV5MNH4_9ACTN|nr:anthranilate phosphoribosyltransferase [Dactylosporangium vinaceum]UAB95093.1 anthranilate phosphoribosyltransferase [Dactylosporangium vinaceum]